MLSVPKSNAKGHLSRSHRVESVWSGLSAGLAGVAASEAVTRDSGVERSGIKATGTTSAPSERRSSVPGRTQAVRAAASRVWLADMGDNSKCPPEWQS